jgi:hypothetical protein
VGAVRSPREQHAAAVIDDGGRYPDRRVHGGPPTLRCGTRR